ncbi:MAG: DUF2520 domain-containing protein [Desulfuromonas sp.]|nr:DUF2520 domain-containing protein [Desulfuromonas sp.]
MKPNIAVIGPGRLGQALAARLRQLGYPITAIVGRDIDRTRSAARFIGAELMATTELKRCTPADIIFITTADDQLAATAQQLYHQAELRANTMVIHCSGLHPATIVQPNNDELGKKILCLAMHPLQTFASAELGLTALSCSYFSLEGATAAIATGQQLVQDLGGTAFTIDASSKVLYHAAACMAANFITTLLGGVADTLKLCATQQEIPLAAMAPLINTAVTNTLSIGAAQALTGPIVRGDCDTVARHLHQLKQADPQLWNLYQSLALHTTRLARQSQRLSPEMFEQMVAVINHR